MLPGCGLSGVISRRYRGAGLTVCTHHRGPWSCDSFGCAAEFARGRFSRRNLECQEFTNNDTRSLGRPLTRPLMTRPPEPTVRRYGKVFDEVATEYDRHRPGYPDELVDHACR